MLRGHRIECHNLIGVTFLRRTISASRSFLQKSHESSRKRDG